MLKIFREHQNKILLAITILFFLGFCFLLFYRLGVHPYVDWDESIYAQVAKEAFESKRFFDLTYFGEGWYEKPPLIFWLISISYAIGGINEWAARIPTLLAAIGAVALSLRWVWELRKSYTAVIMTLACYFIMFPFTSAAYFLSIDSVVGFFALLTLYAWWKAKDNSNWYFVRGIALGLAVMTKSVVGLFPLVPIIIYAIVQRDFAFLKNIKFWYGIGLALLIAVPWHLYQSLTVGQPFWDSYFIYHVLDRFNESLEGHKEPFWLFFEIIFQRYLIAGLIFGGSMIYSLWLAWKDRDIRFIWISAAALFLIFSSGSTKLAFYITMVLPLIVMLSGISLGKIIEHIPKKWMAIIVVFIISTSFIYTGYSFNRYKLALGEYSEEFLTNKSVGEFLNSYRRDLPVYINVNYKNLGIGYYANRPIIPTDDKSLTEQATERVFRTHFESVYLGKDYLIIVR